MVKFLFKNYSYFFIFLFSLFFLFLLSGCDNFNINGGTGDYTGSNKIDTTGTGLSVDFNLDTKWITNKLVGFDLSLGNSGLNPITLNNNNFKLSVEQVGSVIDNLDNVKNTLFNNGDLILYHDQNFKSIAKGQFNINDNYFNDPVNNLINLFLTINYDYVTDFSNNIQIDMNTKTLKVMDTLGQAAPVQVKKVLFKPTNNPNIYQIGFYVKDFSSYSNIDYKKVKFSNIEFSLGTNSLSSCAIWREKNSQLFKISDSLDFSQMKLDSNIKELIFVCDVDLSSFDDTEIRNTIISGKLEYNNQIRIKKTIKLPEKRSSENTW